MNELGILLIQCGMQVTLLMLLAAIVYGIAKWLAPANGSTVPLTALLVVTGLSLVTFVPWAGWNTWVEAREKGRPLASDNTVAHTVPSRAIDDHEPDANREALSALAQPQSSGSDTVVSPGSETLREMWIAISKELNRARLSAAPAPRRWPAIVAWLFIIAATVGLLRACAGLWSVRTYRRTSRPVTDAGLLELADALQSELRCGRKVEVRESDRLTTAGTIGWRHPLILLPRGWSAWSSEERRAVLAHEMAHIHAGHFLAMVAAQLAVVLHFYHPLVHWLCGRLRLEQELTADAIAAAAAGGRTIYLRTLAELALRQPDQRLNWATRTFLPTRTTLLRRIEMLRNTNHLTTQAPRALRAGTVAILLAAGVAAAGLRNPADGDGQDDPAKSTDVDVRADDAPPAGKSLSTFRVLGPERTAKLAGVGVDGRMSEITATLEDDAPGGMDFIYIPVDTVAVAAIRPRSLMDQPSLESLKAQWQKEKGRNALYGVPWNDLEQVTLVVLRPTGAAKRGGHPIGSFMAFVIRTVASNEFAELTKTVVADAVEASILGYTYFKPSHPGHGKGYYYRADDRTVIVANDEGILQRMILSGRSNQSPFVKASAKQIEQAHVAAVIDTNWVSTYVDLAEAPLPASAFSPLWESTQTVSTGVTLGRQVDIQLTTLCTNEAAARQVKETIAAAMTLSRNALKGLRDDAETSSPGDHMPFLLTLFNAADQLLTVPALQQQGAVVSLNMSTQVEPGTLLGLLATQMPPFSVTAAREQSAKNNLKMLGLAMHNYHDIHQRFPNAVGLGPDGKTPHSWRVELLPFLDQAELYEEYRMDEPWDSEHNKRVLDKMPDVFRYPSEKPDSTNSCYFALTGDGALFANKPGRIYEDGSRLRDFLDGPSNTLMLVEAKRDIPWTKPDDIPVDPDASKPLPALGGFSSEGFHILFADGVVRMIPSTTTDGITIRLVADEVLRGLITKAGGERGAREFRMKIRREK